MKSGCANHLEEIATPETVGILGNSVGLISMCIPLFLIPERGSQVPYYLLSTGDTAGAQTMPQADMRLGKMDALYGCLRPVTYTLL